MTRLLITAGPTRERIDPVRFISNYSTGTFGFEIAKEAKKRGWSVTLISGPTCLKPPVGIKLIRVESAAEMLKAVKREIKKCDCLIMAAAVSDWRMKGPSKNKIKRKTGKIVLELTANPDILFEAKKTKKGAMTIGFALETEMLEENALKKLRGKRLDFIVANKLSAKKWVFGDTQSDILIMDKFGNKEYFRRRKKRELAKIVLDKVANFNI